MESGPNKYPKAFPTSEEYESEGMTLRDYFAAKALAGLMANPKTILEVDERHITIVDDIGITTYQIADAMLKARAL